MKNNVEPFTLNIVTGQPIIGKLMVNETIAVPMPTNNGKKLIMDSYIEDIVKKEYETPAMHIIEMHLDTQLLAGSSVECENPYWCGEHEGWQGGWGDN